VPDYCLKISPTAGCIQRKHIGMIITIVDVAIGKFSGG
jgi:hypothetical protein